MGNHDGTLEGKSLYILKDNIDYCEYKQGGIMSKLLKDHHYMLGKAISEMTNLVVRLGEVAQEYYLRGDMKYKVTLSHDEQNLIKKEGLDDEYIFLFTCYNMAIADEVYGQMVKNNALKNIEDPTIHLHATTGMLAGYMHIAPRDPVVKSILDTYDILAPSNLAGWIRNEYERALLGLTDGGWRYHQALWGWEIDMYGNQLKH